MIFVRVRGSEQRYFVLFFRSAALFALFFCSDLRSLGSIAARGGEVTACGAGRRFLKVENHEDSQCQQSQGKLPEYVAAT